MNSSAPSWLLTVIFVPLVGFLLYRRFRGAFVRQPIAAPKMVVRMCLFAALCVLLLSRLPTTTGVMAASAGAAIGLILAAVALAHTRFEVSAEGHFYTPNKWIGLVVSALLLGRIAARTVTVYQASAAMEQGANVAGAFQRSPLTLGLFFLMAAYYIAYYVGVLRKRRLLPAPQSPPG